MWYDIKQAVPPKGLTVIGAYVPEDYNDEIKIIKGQRYDLQPNALIDFTHGKWMEITLWTHLPSRA